MYGKKDWLAECIVKKISLFSLKESAIFFFFFVK